MREDSPLFAVLNSCAISLFSAREVVYQPRMELQPAICTAGVLFELELERHGDASIQRLVPRAVTHSEQRGANLAQRVRLNGTITHLVCKLQGKLPKLKALRIPATLNRHLGSRDVGHREGGAARQLLKQGNGTRDTLVRAAFIAHGEIFLSKQTQHA